MVSRRKLAVSIGVVAVAAISLLAANWAGAQGKATSLPRNQMLITSGSSWGSETNFNFVVPNVTGTIGLCYETLLRYDPLADKYIPWLAKSAGFQGLKYVITLRSGVKFSNGAALTPAMVVQDINLNKIATDSWNTLWLNIKSMKVKGSTITVSFKGTPNYIQWQNMMYNMPVVYYPQYASANATTLTTIGSASGFVPIGTGS